MRAAGRTDRTLLARWLMPKNLEARIGLVSRPMLASGERHRARS
jgi:hypothetical protein